jgi:hypothetical protein
MPTYSVLLLLLSWGSNLKVVISIIFHISHDLSYYFGGCEEKAGKGFSHISVIEPV